MKDPNEFFNKYPKDPGIFNFDELKARRPLYSIIPYQAELEFYKIATTLSLNSDLHKKYQLIDDLARRLDLTFLARGTNRSVYTVNYDSSIIIKIGYDKAGITDSKREFENQQFIKPFCTKCFEVSPTGTVGLFERVTPIKHLEEFKSMAADIFDMLYKKILGRYIMADIGMDQYMNYGFRPGFGPVILDYPYMYELDQSKLRCRNILMSGTICNGKINYDDKYEHLICDTCGKEYNARDLAKEIQHTQDRELFKGLMEESAMKVKSYGSNASFDSSKGGKIETQVETITLPAAEQTSSKPAEEVKPVKSYTQDQVEEMIQRAYVTGIVHGQSQNNQRTFNPTGETQQPVVQQPKQNQPTQEPANTQQQPVAQQPKEKNTTIIGADKYRPYRDPAPRGKGKSNYTGWQTPRSSGRPIVTVDKPKAPNPKNEQPKQNQSQQPNQVQQPKGQQKPQQQQGLQQPKPNAPKPRDPYLPKQQGNQNPKPRSDQSTERGNNQPRNNQQPDRQKPPMNANEAFRCQPANSNYQYSNNRPFVSEPKPQSANSYDSIVADKIMKHVILFCVENAETRDDVIYELTYITTLYHIELDSKFDVPMKSIRDVVRKIVDLIEDKLDNAGIKIRYEYEDTQEEQEPQVEYNANDFPSGDLTPITDDQEDRLNYNDRLRNNGITFSDDVIPLGKPSDQISQEVGTIFRSDKSEELQQVAENLLANNANPNSTATSEELTRRIQSQVKAQ